MKGKFKFSANVKEEKNNTKLNEVTESESFNISELQDYYAKFSESFKSKIKIKINFKKIIEIEEKINHLSSNLENNTDESLNSKEKQNEFLQKIEEETKIIKEDYKLNASFLSNYDQNKYLSVKKI